MPRENRVHIHLVECDAAVRDMATRHDFEITDQGGGIGSAMRLDEPDHDVQPARSHRVRLGEHAIRLADARCGPDVHLELAAPALANQLQEIRRVGRRIGPVWRFTRRLDERGARCVLHGVPEAGRTGSRLSSAILSSRTLTRGSPKTPSWRPSTWRSTSARTPRARATRITWSIAFAGEMCGSSPEPDVVTMSAGTGPRAPSMRCTLSTRAAMLAASARLVGPAFVPPDAVPSYPAPAADGRG